MLIEERREMKWKSSLDRRAVGDDVGRIVELGNLDEAADLNVAASESSAEDRGKHQKMMRTELLKCFHRFWWGDMK